MTHVRAENSLINGPATRFVVDFSLPPRRCGRWDTYSARKDVAPSSRFSGRVSSSLSSKYLRRSSVIVGKDMDSENANIGGGAGGGGVRQGLGGLRSEFTPVEKIFPDLARALREVPPSKAVGTYPRPVTRRRTARGSTRIFEVAGKQWSLWCS